MPNEPRAVRLNIRLEESELIQIKDNAARADISTSEYVRRRCLTSEGRPCIIVDIKALEDIHVQLRRTGNNLNQIARELNTRHKPAEIEGLMRDAFRQTAQASAQTAAFIEEARKSI